MTKVQIVLTPAESKKLIAKSVLEMDSVKRALNDGMVVLHPSSTTYFIMEYLTGEKPEGVWIVGMIAPRGCCIEGLTLEALENDKYTTLKDPNNFPFSWVFRKGKYEKGLKLGDVLNEMGEGDVYIKGVNAIDSNGYVGILIANTSGAGTIGKVLALQRTKPIQTIYLGGLEKFIPTSIKEVAIEGGRVNIKDALGLPCALLPIKAEAITEIQALRILADVEAIPFAAGGVGGAEGCFMMVVKGEEEEVKKAMKLVKEIKGAKTPDVIMPDCQMCHFPGCYLSVGK